MLPHEIVRVTQRPQEVELYFPPLRNLEAAAGFGAFGALSVALPVAAAAGVHLTDTPGVHSWLAMILVAGFALPIMVFGFVFLALGAYLPANSLTVRAGADRVATTRRVFGWVIARRALPCSEITALEPQVPRQFQSQFGAEARYRLVARSRDPNGPALVVAESLPGRAAMREVAELITRASGISLREK
jgi:hypothetical protein